MSAIPNLLKAAGFPEARILATRSDQVEDGSVAHLVVGTHQGRVLLYFGDGSSFFWTSRDPEQAGWIAQHLAAAAKAAQQ